MLASVVLGFLPGPCRKKRWSKCHRLFKREDTVQEKEEALQDAAANYKLEEVVHDAESELVLELMREFQEVEGNNGDTLKKNLATIQEAAADMEEKVNEVEDDAALGLLEEDLEELEEELEEVKDDPDE
ncbi:PREDICTED: uncharacterized protein LOC109473750 [Branchiostoma belcheri]|uniref:Uncharacterized protein LOC109473750 n=1 Tax=Branchiostoma belcheri TaxID=7741 RepID=A0A6P4ZID3_BRABE|nr:PREDICTED: uncharacterized protein LOC109473750 [Branchiostoma belcheri]